MITGVALLAFGATGANAADATSAADAPVSTGAVAGVHAGQAGAIVMVDQGSADSGTAATAGPVQELVVTGSRIPQPNLTSISPIQSVGQQEFKLEGHTDVIDLLNNLPQEFQNNTSDFSNTGNPLASPGGITTADLRGLGPQRTLVLVNGRRLGIGDANTGNNNPAPDLDQIPAAMIDHVEVVTGGASATYGSDAVAGVVNFILKKDFEGLQIDGTLGIDQHTQHNGAADSAIQAGIAGGLVGPLTMPGDKWDGPDQDASIIFGANAPDGKGNVTAYFEFHHQSPVLFNARDFSDCQMLAHAAKGSQFCNGSPNSNLFDKPDLSGPCPTNPSGSGTCTVQGHSFVNFPQAGTSPPSYFNSNNYEYLSRADTRYIAGYEAHYDFSKELQVYSEFNFMSDHTQENIAPSGAFAGGNPFDASGAGGFLINCGNPFLSAQENTALGCAGPGDPSLIDVQIGRRNIEGGPRIATYDHFNYRVVLGARGDLGDAWHYDAYGSHYYTFLNQENLNYLSYSRIGKALDVVNVAGVPTCQSVVDGSDPNCVPYNIFQTGGVTQAALNYLNIIGTESGSVTEDIVEGDITGDLGKYGIKSPWATDGVGVSFGGDWRGDELNFVPDAIIGSGDLAGGSGVGATIHKGLGVSEVYGELSLPIAQDQPFFKSLSVNAGLRYSKYTSGPAPVTYKVGLEWAPIDDFRFRASYQKAIRAPSIIELFNPVTVTQSNSFGSNVDPCATTHPIFTAAQCANTGVTAGQYGSIANCPAKQCDVSTGGNTALQPEQADTYSVGATFTPHWVRGLTFSIDWWDILEKGFVGTIPPNIIVSECATTGSAAFCDLIHRSPSTGALFGPSDLTTGGYVVGTGLNIAAGSESGIDFQGNYRLDLEDVGVKGMGSLAFDFNGALLLTEVTSLPGVASYDCTGLFGSKCQVVSPAWRHTFRVSWNTPWNVLASLQWRYIGSVDLDTNTTNPTITNGKNDQFDAQLPAVNYLDLSAAWRVTSNLTVRGGINNILDQDPPLVNNAITGTGTPNTYPTYDLLGRELFMSATLKF